MVRRDAMSLRRLRQDARECQRCDLWKQATQTVFGKGPARAKLMFVGEQPGDQEDLSGEPFVGPAGQLLRRALQEAGIDPDTVYLTNAVKHFKWRKQGKRRIHERPRREEVVACHLWLEGEIAAIRPAIIVALGATAAVALLGSAVRVTRDRGRYFPSPLAPAVTLTVHPSSILRAPDEESRHDAHRRFVRDLKAIGQRLNKIEE
jgi:uracil-DNA glycosylase family protein